MIGCFFFGKLSGLAYWMDPDDPGDLFVMERTTHRIYFAPIEDEI
jgi:hypothetical protein